VASYRLPERAAADVLEIAAYTADRFGPRQAQRYHAGLERILQAPAKSPGRGRNAPDVGPNMLRYNYESHVVFYRPNPDGVLIVRVLHQAMDAARHQMKDD
jgi:toxin ParE1/3/4